MLKKLSSILLIILLLSQSAFANEIILDNMEAPSFENPQKAFLTGGVKTEAVQIEEMPEGEEIPFISFYSSAPFSEILPMYIEAYIEEYDALPTLIAGIENYGITLENLEENYYDAVVRNPYLLLHTAIGYYDTNNDGIIEAIVPIFHVADIAELKEAQQAMREGMQEYIDLADEYDTPLEKLLAIHDKMVENCVYDERVMSNDPSVVAQAPSSVYHAVGVFRDKFAVCQGYSQALYMLGKELGIEIDLCESNDVNHMWNYVKMNGKWYHMDMTNEDPKDPEGRASHRFFLVSDDSLDMGAHGTSWRRHGSSAGYPCNDTTYESDHFFNLSLYFKGYRDEDGFYHAYMGLSVPASEIDTVIDIKSKGLYTGAVLVAPFVTEGKYNTTQNGVQVQKKGTNLYMAELTTRGVANVMPILKFRNTFTCMSARTSMNDNSLYLRLIATEAQRLTVSDFTSFVLDSQNLTPYSMKTAWD